jgi:flagellar biosynthetic protein FliR
MLNDESKSSFSIHHSLFSFMLDDVLQHVPVFVLVLFRIAGMMLFAPLFGSARIPRRVRVMLAVILAMGMSAGVAAPAHLPDTPWQLALGIGGEMMFGLAMGMILSLVFIAAQWAGEIIGQQMGFNLSEVFDPSFGKQGSLIGDMYFMLTLVIFLAIRGHHAMLIGVRASFDALPLLSVGINQSLLDTLAGLLQASTALAIQLAAPMLVTMLIVDLSLGFIGKTMPQLNIMAAGLSMRSALGMVVVIAGLSLTSNVIRGALVDSMQQMSTAWTTPSR